MKNNKSNKVPIKTLKSVSIVIAIISVLALAAVIIINFLFRPLPENKRNLTKTDSKIIVTFNNEDEHRTPIIRTYKESEYSKLSKEKQKKIIKIVEGNIEGDIPAVELKGEKAYINIKFTKDGRSIEPDTIPEIKIEQLREDSNDIERDMKEIVIDKLEETKGLYRYKLDRYAPQTDKYFMHFNLIKIYYQIDGEGYVSIFALNTTNADKDVDWFEDNEELDTIIDIEMGK